MNKIAVIIETSRHQIVGTVSLPPRTRLSDYASEDGRDFYALTDVVISPLDRPERERETDFMLVARHQVALLRPVDERPAAEPRWAFSGAMERELSSVR